MLRKLKILAFSKRLIARNDTRNYNFLEELAKANFKVHRNCANAGKILSSVLFPRVHSLSVSYELCCC